MTVLESLLSADAHATVTMTVTTIEGRGTYLHENSNPTVIAFFGDPSDTGAPEVQFGGRHLGINAALDGTAAIAFAPTHLSSAGRVQGRRWNKVSAVRRAIRPV